MGGAAGDSAAAVAVDAQGNAYITGQTESSDFPTRNPFDGVPPPRFSSKAFISKFAPDGSLIYSTFFGGNDSSSAAAAIAVDAMGNIYVAGSVGAGFPTTSFPIKNAFQPTPGGNADAFITKFNADGTAITFSSYLGGNQPEGVKDLKLDSQNNVYIVGEINARGATSVTFPTVNPTQANYGGGDRDIFLSIVSSNGSSLLFSTYFGGSGDERVRSVSVSSDGSQVAIIGASNSTNLTTSGIAAPAVDPSCDDLKSLIALFSGTKAGTGVVGLAIVQKVIEILRDQLGRQPTCAEILAGLLKNDPGTAGLLNNGPGTIVGGVTLPPAGSGLIGQSASSTVQPAGGGFDVGVATANQTGNFIIKGLFGGSRDEFVSGAAIDARGAVYVTGDTNSTNLPTVNPTQSTFGGGDIDGFVVVFAPDTFEPVFATYLGGNGSDLPTGIAVDPQGNIFVSGIVISATTFPTTPGAFQRELKGSSDAFLVKISPVFTGPSGDFSLGFDSPTVTGFAGTKARVTVNINRAGGFTGNVTVTPPAASGGIKPKPPDPIATTENSITFKMKIGGGVAPGSYPLMFTARDDAGRQRNATVTLIVQ